MVNCMNLILILKGFIVGIGKIIPGVSGSMLAITLGVYERVLEAITNFFSNPKQNIKLLVNFSFGLFLAIIFFSRLILFSLNNYYDETMFLFIGLILGTMIPFTKKLKFNLKNILIILVGVFLTIILTNIKNSTTYLFNDTILDYIYVAFLGMIDAFTSIVPGISGTAIYMTFGVYEFVLSILGNPFSFLFIIYGIGLILGIILISYLMVFLLKKYKDFTYSIIFAFMLSSILILILKVVTYLNIYLVLIFIVGIIIGYMFDKTS